MTSTASPPGTPPVAPAPPPPPAPTCPTPPPPADGARPRFRPWTDTTLLLGGISALLYFAGWSYEHAFYKRFAIDPAAISTSSSTLALEGVDAMLSAIPTMLLPIAGMAFVLMLLALVADWLDKRYFAAGSPRNFTALVITLWRSLAAATAIVLFLRSDDAGQRAAGDRFQNVRAGAVWNYHLENETVSGVTIGQNPQATWILTSAGVRQVKTDAIRMIDGPLLASSEAIANAR